MKAIIMAAGKGTRLVTEENPLPKVLRLANGKPILQYVLNSIDFMKKEEILLVVGYGKEAVVEAFPAYPFAVQEQQNGTGSAVKCGMEAGNFGEYEGDILVLSGDVPLIQRSTLLAMMKQHEEHKNACTLLTCITEKIVPFGRIVRKNGKIVKIVEDKDCTAEEKQIKEVNVALYLFNAKKLMDALSKIQNNNTQGEYYLTDVPRILICEEEKVETYTVQDETQLLGVNTVQDLKEIEAILQSQKL